MTRHRASTPCPHCDGAVPAGALACPACGSDAHTGWSDEADAWAGGLPDGYDAEWDDDDADYREFLRREGLADDGQPSREVLERRGIVVTVALLLAALLAWLVLR